MRVVPIPDARVWNGARRTVLLPPDGDMTNEQIAPVEVLADTDELGQRVCILVELEQGDVQKLTANGQFWLIMYGRQLPVFALEHV